MSDAREASRQAALEALVAVARRLDAAGRLTTPVDDTLLTAVARTAATVLDAQAVSIAVHDPTRGRLVFAAAAGPAAGNVVGIAIDDSAGIAGYAFSTGQPLAVADVSTDPRFDRTVADVTGYVPGSILATPLIDAEGTVGVLEALDRRTGTFSLRDLDVAAAIAQEAVAVVRAGRARHDATGLLGGALRAVLTAGAEGDLLDDEVIDALVEDVVASLPGDPDFPTLRLADRIARLREVDPDSIELAIEWLDVLLRRGVRGRRSMGRGPRS